MTARSARNPQAEQMAHESMVRTLTSQAEAIWPQEREILTRYSLPRDARVLDVGCGTGEALLRLAHENPGYRLTGVDLHEPHLTRAREQARPFGTRVRIELGDAFALDCPDGSYDLTLCRHLLQAVPDPELVLAELKRVTRPGGILHLLVEDYGMIHCHPCAVDADRFWREGPMVLGERLGTDLLAGRKAWSWLQALGLTESTPCASRARSSCASSRPGGTATPR